MDGYFLILFIIHLLSFSCILVLLLIHASIGLCCLVIFLFLYRCCSLCVGLRIVVILLLFGLWMCLLCLTLFSREFSMFLWSLQHMPFHSYVPLYSSLVFILEHILGHEFLIIKAFSFDCLLKSMVLIILKILSSWLNL